MDLKCLQICLIRSPEKTMKLLRRIKEKISQKNNITRKFNNNNNKNNRQIFNNFPRLKASNKNKIIKTILKHKERGSISIVKILLYNKKLNKTVI